MMLSEIRSTELHTLRLLLRPPRLEDVDAEFRIASDPEFAFFAMRHTATREGMAESVARRVARTWTDGPDFVVILEGHLIGDVRLDIDHPNALAELGYGIAREHWGKGLTTEAVQAVVDYTFRTFDVAKTWARADPRNDASVRVLEKLGMTQEGVLRKHLVRRGERVDRVYYGLLRTEWELADRSSA